MIRDSWVRGPRPAVPRHPPPPGSRHMTVPTTPAADAASLCRAWADDLAAWQLPESVTAQVDGSPWVLPTEVFARRADHLLANPGGPSHTRALQAWTAQARSST